MEKCVLMSGFMALLTLAACSSHKNGSNGATYTPPPTGSIIAADSCKVTGDVATLNNFMFTVAVKADSNSQTYGVYDVVAKWGPNDAFSQFTMPRGGEKLQPILKKGAEPYTYIVGFHYGDDTAFYDYYQVAGNNGTIEMKYIRAYSFK